LAVPDAALEMRRRGHGAEAVERLIYHNPLRFLSQCPGFKLPAA
jgi:predicted metal-dependent TIM-barrel fold hydrolase